MGVSKAAAAAAERKTPFCFCEKEVVFTYLHDGMTRFGTKCFEPSSSPPCFHNTSWELSHTHSTVKRVGSEKNKIFWTKIAATDGCLWHRDCQISCPFFRQIRFLFVLHQKYNQIGVLLPYDPSIIFFIRYLVCMSILRYNHINLLNASFWVGKEEKSDLTEKRTRE